MLAKTKDEDSVDLGNKVILTGPVLQVLFIVFVTVPSVFHIRISRSPTEKSFLVVAPWAPYLWILYFASALIVVRCIFRIAEYAGGQEGLLVGNEVYMYIFDAAIMFVVMVVFNLQHPGIVINRQAATEYRMEQLYS